MPGGRLRGLDGVRGIAVIAVVLFHAGVAPSGFTGVDVFFVLSGFLITGILRSEFSKTGHIRLRRFTARRLLRLYPALLVVCGFVLALGALSRRGVDDIAGDVLRSLTYTSNLFPMSSGLLGHTWTLSLEEQFYLVWPALLLLGLRFRGAWAWLPTAGILVAVLAVDLATGQSEAIHTYVRAMGLPLGCALAFASGRVLRLIGLAAIVTAPVLVLAFLLPLPAVLTTGWPISIGAVLAAPLVAAAATRRIAPLEWAPLRWFGLRSYSLYLWHLPLMSLMHHQAPDSIPLWLRLTVGVIASLIAAELSHRFVEQPVLRWRDRHVRQRTTPDTASDSGVRTD